MAKNSGASLLKPGTELGCSSWHLITQEQINRFYDATFDPDPVHIDPEWAVENSPFPTTIAFGFQTISLLTMFSHEVFKPWVLKLPELDYYLNYGFEQLRLLAPIPVGSEIRGRFAVKDVVSRSDGGCRLCLDTTVEIRHSEKPALAAEWIILFYFREGVSGEGIAPEFSG